MTTKIYRNARQTVKSTTQTAETFNSFNTMETMPRNENWHADNNRHCVFWHKQVTAQ